MKIFGNAYKKGIYHAQLLLCYKQIFKLHYNLVYLYITFMREKHISAMQCVNKQITDEPFLSENTCLTMDLTWTMDLEQCFNNLILVHSYHDKKLLGCVLCIIIIVLMCIYIYIFFWNVVVLSHFILC